MGFLRLEPIAHELATHYAALRALPNRRALEASALWPRIRAEVERVVAAVERGDRGGAPAPERQEALRIAAWNVQRGARFDALLGALRGEPSLRGADLLLLTEIDSGLGRSGNRNVARELAEALDLNYAFAPSYLTLGDDWGENPERVESSTALAGTAILSRPPIRRAEGVALPVLRDKFGSSEKRLGSKRALVVEVEHAGRAVTVGALHLDSNASPAERAHQAAALLDRLGGGAAVVGGDFNSSTHDLSSPFAIAREVVRILRRGIGRTVDGYMTPERSAERPVFDLLGARGFLVDGFNDRAAPTYRYDFNDPYALEQLRRVGGRLFASAVRRLLRRWNACLPARLDWLAGRGVRPRASSVVDPRDAAGHPISDHAAVICDVGF